MLNCFQVEGYLAGPPREIMNLDGTSFFQILLAVPRDPTRNSRKRVSDFLRISAYGAAGEIMRKYPNVGQHLVIKGHIASYKVRRKERENESLFFNLVMEKAYFTRGDASLSPEELEEIGQEEIEAQPVETEEKT